MDLAEDDRKLVLGILAAHLPPESTVWVFGSRAIGRARRYSDLDLAIDAGRPLTLDETAILRDAFSDSDLSYKVDIIDWQAIDSASGNRSRPSGCHSERVALTGAPQPCILKGGCKR
ncbi:MAG TPA: nucleotidyltransferase domain-containing protein [Stellaceae bacterium]|jgi:predicted nucleotidyltransferase